MADQNFRVKRGLEVGVGGTIITAKSTGNVGISSAEPTVKLDVGGDVKATTFVGALTGTATTASNLNRSVTAGAGLAGGGTLTSDVTLNVGAGSGISINADDVQLKNAGSLTNNYLTKWDSANTQLTNSTVIDTGTNIGIGTTNPLQRLQVGTANTLGISTDGKVFVVTSNSDVGIGTTNPTSKLHVIGDARIVGTITATTFVGALTGTATTASNLNRSVTAGAGLAGGGTLTSDVTLNVGAGSGISINADDVQLKNAGSLTGNRVTKWDSGNTQLTNSIITDDGTNIGINSSSPTSRLDVGGDGRFTGVVTATTFLGNLTGTATTATTISSDSDSNTKGGTGAGSSLVASSGTNNTFFGFSAGCRVTTGDYNIALGSLALLGSASGVTGSHNVAIGRCAGADLTSGACNNFLGYFAGHQLVSGSDNNFFGSAAGYANTSGNSNNFLGYYAGRSNTTGCYNNFFGSNAGYCNITQSNSIAIGKEAGYWNRGNNNIYLGECAGRSATRTCIFPYTACTTGSHNVAIGKSAGANLTAGIGNNFLGLYAGMNTSSGGNNNFLGNCAGICNTTGGANNFFGDGAGFCNTTGNWNNFFGGAAGFANTTGGNNNFLGFNAGFFNCTGSHNNFFGRCAGAFNTTGSDNFFGGYKAGNYNDIGCRNIILGKCAGFQVYTGYTNGDDNTFLGEFSGKSNISGSGNIFLGRFSGCTNTTGSCNIAIGYSAQLPITTGSNQLVIGSGNTSWINGNSSYNVGLGTTNPTTKLHVIGDVTATTFVGALTGTATTASDLNRSVIAGSGLTGGGTLTADVTLNVGAGSGISINADDVQLKNAGSLTGNRVTKWDSGNTQLTNSIITDDGTNIGIGSTQPAQKLDVSGNLYLNGNGTTATIFAPTNLVIDPSPVGVGTTSGSVRIYGDLYVDGTQFVVNSTTIDLADFRIGIGTTATSDLVLDGAGIGIGSAGYQKTFIWNNSSSSLKSSENLDLASGKTYKIDGTDILTTTTLGSLVVNSSLTSVGTLGQLNVSGISTLGVTTATNLTSQQLNVSGISTLGVTTATNLTSQQLNVSGISTLSGSVGIGTTNPTSKLYVVGDGYFTGIVTATDFNSASDAKLKTNIQLIEDPLNKVAQIQGVSFNWIENNKPSMGVIADEVEKILPELVSDTDPKTVNYNGLIGLLIEVVKEQQLKIESLEQRITKLE